MKLKIPTTIIFENLENSTKFITVNQGGARSSKTYNEVLWLIRVALCPDIWEKYNCKNPIISICRDTLPALKASAYRDFLEIMTNNNLYNLKLMNKTELIYQFETGAMIEFFSLDDAQKLKSRKRDFLLVPECNENNFEVIRQLLLRTKCKAIFDFNPSEDFWIYDKILTRPDAEFFITTYKNNPFLDERIKQEIEMLQFEDENAWRIYGLGEKGQRQELIYPNVEYLDSFDGIQFEETIFGLDFGYNNPIALMEISLKDKEFYEKERLHQSFLTNGQLIEWLKNNLSMQEKRYIIYADCAEPQRIKEIADAGFYIKPADKSVKDGIDFCKRYKTYCLNSDINNKKEKKNYSWKKDKNGNILDEPIKFLDHCQDGSRYAKYTHYKDAFGKNIDDIIGELESQLKEDVDYGDFRDDY